MATKTQSTTKVAPLADRVVVKALEDAEQMRGGLFIPDTAHVKRSRGICWLAQQRRRMFQVTIDQVVPVSPSTYSSFCCRHW